MSAMPATSTPARPGPTPTSAPCATAARCHAAATSTGARRPRRADDVAVRGPHLLVELELPEVTGEGGAGVELADVRLDLLPARQPHDQLGVGAARQRR